MASNYSTEITSYSTEFTMSGEEVVDVVVRVVINPPPTAVVPPHNPAISTEVSIMYNHILDTVLKKHNCVDNRSYRLLICDCVSGSSPI